MTGIYQMHMHMIAADEFIRSNMCTRAERYRIRSWYRSFLLYMYMYTHARILEPLF